MELITYRRPLNEKISKREIHKIASQYGLSTKGATLEYVEKGFSSFNEKTSPITKKEFTIKEGERAVIKVASSACIDRDGEIVIPSGIILDHYKDNPVALAGHEYKGLPLGRNEVSVSDDGYQFIEKTIYSDNHATAREYYNYQKEGMPLSASIGFIPMEWIERGNKQFDAKCYELTTKGWLKSADIARLNRIYTKVLLLEISDVAVPSNPEALIMAVGKGFGGLIAKDCRPIRLNSDDVAEVEKILAGYKAIEKALTHNSTVNEDEPEWGTVDKTKLPEKAFVFEAPGHDSEKKSTWSYPHHYVVDGEVNADSGVYTSGDMYLHKGGLMAAYAAAMGARSGQRADEAVIAHLEEHRKAIGMMEEDMMGDEECPECPEEDACKPKPEKDAGTIKVTPKEIVGASSILKAIEDYEATIKAGRVLSAGNRAKIEAAITALNEILSADKPENETGIEAAKTITIIPVRKKEEPIEKTIDPKMVEKMLEKSVPVIISNARELIAAEFRKTMKKEIALAMGRVVIDE